ncbi:MAG: nucleoside deaminase [Zetaproteobacteria bacterium]|nr:MAG: nucleoside deaminase [Zetaproteobacteria bacterium]
MPDWLSGFVARHPLEEATPQARMRWLLRLLEQQIAHASGGPFAAAIFTDDRLPPLAAAVNVVVPARCSLAHAEMAALALAQRHIGSHDLRAAGACRLFASCAPCAMCLGALPWSGIAALYCAARSEDALAIGFDEGPRHPQWRQELQRRGITVRCDLLRAEAADLMRRYREAGGVCYNGHDGCRLRKKSASAARTAA